MPVSSRSPAADRARLIEIVKTRSFQSGAEVKLASGRTSSFYFNMKPTMLHAEGGFLIANLILNELENVDTRWIGGLEMGAVPIAAAVAAVSQLRQPPVSAFFVRKQVKEHGTRSLIEGLAPGETLKGARVVIAEDVTTTGGSALKAVDAVRAEGAQVALVITIVDRLEGAGEAFRAAGLRFVPLLTLDDFR
jgi:orotate phosphoribosyltransferase